jgi:sugar lactone lactonase YvrE
MGLALFLAAMGLAPAASAAPPTDAGNFTSPGLCSPRGIALTPAGGVLVGSDCLNPHIARFTAAGVFLGTWSFPPGYIGSPNGLAIDGSGNVFVTDYDGDRVYRLTSQGDMTGVWNAPDGPVDVAVNGLGEVFVSGLIGRQVWKFTNGGTYLATIGSTGLGSGQFYEPNGLAVDALGRLYVADSGRGRVLRFLPNGSFEMEFATPSPPQDVAVGPDGRVYVVPLGGNTVYQYSAGGTLLTSFQSLNGMNGAFRIAISPTGVIYITEQYNHRITKFQIDLTTGAIRRSFGELKVTYR